MTQRSVQVYLGCGGTSQLVGTAYFHDGSTRLRTSFSYSESWLSRRDSFALCPSMPLQVRQYQSNGLPGFLGDAAPDRWGRHLIFRGAQVEATRDHTAIRALDDVDYLLGVDDWSRMGALRLSIDGGHTFLGKGTDIPKLVRLPELLDASRSVSAGTDGWRQVKSLLDAGSSSLGGARPKATIQDEGTLLIAKFPSAHDQWDVIAWEGWALEMARRAGINVPSTRLVRIGDSTILLSERFDRDGVERTKDRRVPYMSGMCLLGLRDGADSDYAEFADALQSISAKPAEDARELFARVALNVALHNTDDHLRNHGLLRMGGGWRLSPAFDINPSPFAGERRAFPIFGECGTGEVEGLRELGDYLGMPPNEQRRLVRSVTGALRSWDIVARKMGCPAQEVTMFRPVIDERVAALSSFGGS